MALIARYVKL